MTKTIKVSQENYDKLVALMRPRESFDDVVNRLLDIREEADNLLNALEGGIRFSEERRRQLEKTPGTN